MRKIKTTLQLSLILFFAIACSKDVVDELEKEVSVYSVSQENQTIKLRKNTEIVSSITNITTREYTKMSISESGDVYILGTRDFKLWKNGVEMPLSNINQSNVTLKDMAYSNGNLYILGEEVIQNKGIRIVLWKNNEVSYIGNELEHSSPRSFTVDGDDVYIAGHSRKDFTSYAKLTVWKNGVATFPEHDESFFTLDVFSLDNNVYLSAVTPSGSKLWVNGKVETLFENGFDVENIFVNNNDIYAFGVKSNNNKINTPQLYKNGQLFADVGTGEVHSYPVSVSVKNNVVYAGFLESDNEKEINSFKVWKDGEVVTLFEFPINTGWVWDMTVKEE